MTISVFLYREFCEVARISVIKLERCKPDLTVLGALQIWTSEASISSHQIISCR